jgi:acyl carrier protein
MLEPHLRKIADLLQGIRPEFDFSNGANFIAAGMLDSFDMITLVDTLDKTYGISIDGEDIVPEHFGGLAAIAALLGKYGVGP